VVELQELEGFHAACRDFEREEEMEERSRPRTRRWRAPEDEESVELEELE